VSIPWYDACQGPDHTASVVRVPAVPAGSYQVTALGGGGTVWSSVSLPSQGWAWYITCENFAVPGLATPSGTYYDTAAAAFAALPSTTSSAPFTGGDLRCYFVDSACSDNRGGVSFRMERTCP